MRRRGRPYHTRISCGTPGLDVELYRTSDSQSDRPGAKDPPVSERTYSRRRQHGPAAFDGPTIRRLRPFAGADRRATDRRRRERSFSAVGRCRRALLLRSDGNHVAYHSAAKDLPGILRIAMLPGRTHPASASRNEGANRTSVIGRGCQVGRNASVGSRLPVAVLRPQSPLSAPDAEADHTGNIEKRVTVKVTLLFLRHLFPLEQVFLRPDLLDQLESVLPRLLAESRSDHFDHLPGDDGTDRTALTQRQPLA